MRKLLLLTPAPIGDDEDEAEEEDEDTITSDGGQYIPGQNFQLNIPQGAVSEPLSISHTEQAQPQHDLQQGLSAVLGFALEAQNEGGEQVTETLKDYSMTLSYDRAEVESLGIAEETLALAYWDEEQADWVNAPSQVDTDEQQVTATVNRFGEFALVGETQESAQEPEEETQTEHEVHLPVIMVTR